MECRKFVITLISADNLPDVRKLGEMKVYATISLKRKSKIGKKTPVDKEGGTNPRWDFPIQYTIGESTVQHPGVSVVIQLMCKRTLGDRFVGEVAVPLKSLFDVGIRSDKVLSYSVCGTQNGMLNIMYSFGEKILVPRENIRSPRGHSGSWRTVVDIGFVLVRGVLIVLGEDIDGGDDGGDDDYEEDVGCVDGDVVFYVDD